ncbi:MAG: hypothetical protein ACXVRH_06165 [Thermoleophilaceae bacterium]
MTRRRAGIAALVCVALAGATLIQTFSWNQTSHYALIRSIAHGTPHIDRYQDETGDKARYKGHWYSSRAPGLAFVTLPAYGVLTAIHGPTLAHKSKAQRGADEMVWGLTLWGAVLPGLVLLLLVRWMGERFEPGYGTAAAITLGLGTLWLPLSTLLFSHVFTACLGFGAFCLLMREREGPGSLWVLFVSGLLIGYSITAEYPLLFTGLVLGLYVLSKNWRRIERGLVYAGGVAIGVMPLAIYDKWAFGSFTHVAYADLPRHQSGFFGIRPPSFLTFITLLFSSRGLLTLSPVLIMGVIGTVLLYRRGRKAEALVVVGVAVLYLAYNSGYYLPFGGGSPGPRFLTTMLPFLAAPMALAWRRFPAQTLALAVISVVVYVLATITHPLIGYETETTVWTRYATQRFFQPSILSVFNGTRGLLAPLLFVLLALAAVALAVRATPRPAMTYAGLGMGAAIAAAWAVIVILVPTGLGIDHRALENTHKAGDPIALKLPWGPHPLTHLGLVTLGIVLVVLAAAAIAGRGTRMRPERAERPLASSVA